MGLDLTWADAAAVIHRREACQKAGQQCPHEPDCHDAIEPFPEEVDFPYRQFVDVSEIMVRLAMGYEAKSRSFKSFSEGELRDASWDDRDMAWRSQRVPGKKGIALFKLRTNDWWLVTVPEIDEALEAYAAVPERERAELESGKKWAAWIEWLRQSREHGGFEVE
jgi:hypothetical protein